MNNDNPDEIKFETKVNTQDGTLTIPLFQFMQQMNDEQKDELMFDGGFWPFVSDRLLNDLVSGYSGLHYNNHLHSFRKALLTSQNVEPMLQKFSEALLWELENKQKELKEYNDAYWGLRHAVEEHFTHYSINLPEGIKKKIGIPRYDVDRTSRGQWVKTFISQFYNYLASKNPGILDIQSEE